MNTDRSEPASFKRLHESDLSLATLRYGKRRKGDEPVETKRVMQELVRIYIVGQHEDREQNAVWLNSKDYARLFSVIPLPGPAVNSSHYLQIANRVYQAALKEWLPEGGIALTPLQYEDAKKRNAVFTQQGCESVVVAPFDPFDRELNDLSSIKLELEPDRETGSSGIIQRVFNLSELQKIFEDKLCRTFLVKGQDLNVESSLGRFKARVQSMVSSPAAERNAFNESRTVNPYGYITTRTIFDFQLKQAADLAIVDREAVLEHAQFRFQVSLENDSQEVNRTSLPAAIDHDCLVKEVAKVLRFRSLIRHFNYPLKYKDLNLKLRFSKVTLNHTLKDPERGMSGYRTAYRFHSNSEVELVPSYDIVFTKGEPVKAARAEVEIKLFRPTPAMNLSMPWLHAGKLAEIIRCQPGLLVKGQQFEVAHPQALLRLRLIKAVAKDSFPALKEKKCFKPSWQFDKHTEINISSSLDSKLFLTDNDSPVPIKKATLLINKQGSSIAILSEKDLREIAFHRFEQGAVVGQCFSGRIKNHKIEFSVAELDCNDPELKRQTKYGMLGAVSPATEMSFVIRSANIAITQGPELADPIQHLISMGFGGLPDDGKKVIRRLVNERKQPMKAEMEERGLLPSKAVLLYGPPGTGKTLLARCLGSILGCDEDHVEMLSGPSIFNKFVGESERRVRSLFSNARKDDEKFGKDSPLHLVLIDEVDAVLSQRGGDHSKWRNSVVDEFLAQMDGLQQFHNILVVGMTNRIGDLDEAVLRAGRFDDKIEMKAPNAEGRQQILEIHTRELKKKNLLHDKVDLKAIAQKLDGFSGADIRGLVKTAADYALDRLSHLAYQSISLADRPEAFTTMEDFEKAIAETKKTAAVPQEVLRLYI